MVKKITNFIGKEIVNLHQAAYILASFTLVAQLLSFFRGRLLAGEFGASLELDVYYAAFRIPDMMFIIMTAIVSVWILVPYIIKLEQRSLDEAKDLINSVFTIFVVMSGTILVLIVIFMPVISELIFPRLVETELGYEFIMMSRIMCISPFMLGISSFIGSIIQTKRKFMVYAMTPVFYNIGTIVGIIYLYPIFGLQGLAWGVILGSLMHIGVQIPTFLKTNLVPRLKLKVWSKNVKDLIISSIPRTIEAITGQINISIVIIFAGLMSAGAVSVFSLSLSLQGITLALIGASYALAAFPAMSAACAKGDIADMLKHFTTAGRHIIFWTIPASVLFIVLRAQIVRTIFGTGNFNWDDTRLVAASLAIFSISMLPQAMNMLFIKGFYAAGKTWKPLIISMVSTISIPIFIFIFFYVFQNSVIISEIIESTLRIEGSENSNILLLPLALISAIFIQLILLYRSFTKEFGGVFNRLRKILIQALIASVVMGLVSYFSLYYLSFMAEKDTGIGIFLQGLIAGIIGIFTWFMVLVLIGNREIKAVWRTVHSKIWKTKPLVEVGGIME